MNEVNRFDERVFESIWCIPKGVLLLIILNCTPLATPAQLNRLPRVEAIIRDAKQIPDVGLLMLTTTPKRFLRSKDGGSDTFPSCIQIIDPLKPWPPIWYLTADNGMFYNAQIHQDSKLSYVWIEPNVKKAGAAGLSFGINLIIAKDFSIIDTINERTTKRNIDGHDFDISLNGDQLIPYFLDTMLNLSKLTERATDTAVLTHVCQFLVLNKSGQSIFEWNPLLYIGLNQRYPEYAGFGGPKLPPNEYDWDHVNALKWADDGNIIYSFRNIGVGKVNRKTGELMWQLGARNNGIHLDDSVSFFGQHDFEQINSGPYKGKYSVLSCGNETHPYFTGNVYDIDEKKMSAKLIHRFVIDSSHHSDGSGNYIWVNNMQVIGYGMYEPNPELNSRKLAFASIADSSNRILATYYLPSPVYDYRIESLNDETGWKSKMPGRPEITSGNGYLFVNSIAAEQLSWYELESNESNCTLVGKGGKFYPKHSGIYFVVKALPLGNLVSDFVNYHMTK